MVALLMRALGSPNWLMNQDLCGGCRALSDKLTGLSAIGGEDIDNTRCALIVGRNPSEADAVQWQSLKRARANGAKTVVVDPARTSAAKRADLWLRPRPGTDAAVALGMVNVTIAEGLHDADFVTRRCHGFDALKERAARFTPAEAARLSGVPAEDIVEAARMYADGPSTFVSGHGIDAFSAGVQTFRAFHALVAISGNLDRAGGNLRVKRPRGFRNYIELLHDPAFRLAPEVEAQTIGRARFPLWAGPEGWQTACHNPTAIEAMLTGEPYPVRAMYLSGVNIAVTYPDTRKTVAALRSLDFLSVVSHSMTPTAALADIVLPKTTGLEEEEISLDMSGPCVSYTSPVAPARGMSAVGFRDRDRPRRPAGGARGRGAQVPALAHQAGVQRLPARRQRGFLRRAGGEGVRALPLQAREFRGGRVPHADRQDRALLGDPGPARPRPAARFRTAPGGERRAGGAPGLSADPSHRSAREGLSPLALPRPGVGAQGLALSRGSRSIPRPPPPSTSPPTTGWRWRRPTPAAPARSASR